VSSPSEAEYRSLMLMLYGFVVDISGQVENRR